MSKKASTAIVKNKKAKKEKKPKKQKELSLSEKVLNLQVKQIQWFNEHWYKVNFSDIPVDLRVKWGLPETGFDFLASVTTKLGAAPKPWLPKWRGQVGNWEADRIMNEAGNKGTRVHHSAEVILKGGIVIYQNDKVPAHSPEEIAALTSSGAPFSIVSDQKEYMETRYFKKMFRMLNCKVIATEFMLYDFEYRFAGTSDGLVYCEKEQIINQGGSGKHKTIKMVPGYYLYDIKTGSEISEAKKQLAAYARALFALFGIEVKGAFVLHTNAKSERGWNIEAYSEEELQIGWEQFKKVSAVWEIYPSEKPKIFDMPSTLTLESEDVL